MLEWVEDEITLLLVEEAEDELAMDDEDDDPLALLELEIVEDELTMDEEDEDGLILLELERIEDDELEEEDVEDVEDSFELLEVVTTTALELDWMDVVVELAVVVVHAGSVTVLLKS